MSEVRELAADLPIVPPRAVDGEPVDDPAGPAPAVTPGVAGSRRRAVEAQLPGWLLRAGLAFVLSYAATSSFFHPETFARYFPAFMPSTWATELLPVFAVYEMVLAVGLMTDRFTYAAAMLAGFTMLAIIFVNPDVFEVLFRNVAIACGAFALALQSRQERAGRRAALIERSPNKEGMK